MTIKFKLNELIKAKEMKENRKISQASIAREIGVQRSVISKMVLNSNYVTTTSTLDALCEYFECYIGELIEYTPDKK